MCEINGVSPLRSNVVFLHQQQSITGLAMILKKYSKMADFCLNVTFSVKKTIKGVFADLTLYRALI